MYWPTGAPRVYVVNKSLKKLTQNLEDGKLRQDTTPENGAILGLQVSRAGHLFGSITHSSLTIWQTSVPLRSFTSQSVLTDA